MAETAEIVKTSEQGLSLFDWSDKKKLAEVKGIYGKNLTNGEFHIMCEIGLATKTNPFLGEIWAVKYGTSPAQIFIGRNGYRKIAHRNPNYEYHISDVVYENDVFKRDSKGEVLHEPALLNRGNIVFAYALVYKKGCRFPYYTTASFKEYNTGKSLWAGKPETMIKKVAEAQCLRMAFPASFEGTYEGSEQRAEADLDKFGSAKADEGESSVFVEDKPEVEEAEVVKEEPKKRKPRAKKKAVEVPAAAPTTPENLFKAKAEPAPAEVPVTETQTPPAEDPIFVKEEEPAPEPTPAPAPTPAAKAPSPVPSTKTPLEIVLTAIKTPVHYTKLNEMFTNYRSNPAKWTTSQRILIDKAFKDRFDAEAAAAPATPVAPVEDLDI